MTGWVPWLAQANPVGDDGLATPANSKITTLLANDAALVVLAGLCLTLLFTPWAVRIWRKTGRRHRKFKGLDNRAIPRTFADHGALAAPDAPSSPLQRVAAPPPTAPAPPPTTSAARSGRRRARTHRPRNPTLAEIGGLPPLRPDPDSPSAAH